MTKQKMSLDYAIPLWHALEMPAEALQDTIRRASREFYQGISRTPASSFDAPTLTLHLVIQGSYVPIEVPGDLSVSATDEKPQFPETGEDQP